MWPAERRFNVLDDVTIKTSDFYLPVFSWNTTSTCVNQSMNLDPGYKALREYWRRRTRTQLPTVPQHPRPHASTELPTQPPNFLLTRSFTHPFILFHTLLYLPYLRNTYILPITMLFILPASHSEWQYSPPLSEKTLNVLDDLTVKTSDFYLSVFSL